MLKLRSAFRGAVVLSIGALAACGSRGGSEDSRERPGTQAASLVLPSAPQTPYASTVPSACTFKDIAAGTRHTCAVLTSGEVACWGDAYSYVLGIGYNLGKGSDFEGNTLYLHPFPETVRTGPDDAPEHPPFANTTALVNLDVDGTQDGTCALRGDGTVWCWGLGATGYPREAKDDTDTAVSGISKLFGGRGLCAINAIGNLSCGGRSDYTFLLAPVRDTPSTFFAGATSASAGGARRCAIKSDGSAFCWGADAPQKTCTAGIGPEVGLYPEAVFTSSPSALLAGMAQVQNGNGFSCGLTSAGSVRCWGADYVPFGALGDNTTSGTTTSVKCNAANVTDGTAALSGVSAIATGYNHSCALKSDGTVWCWGGNGHGQLGDGSFTSSAVAKKVVLSDGAALSSITKISASFANTCAVRADGAAFCWGFGTSQQIGDGSGIDRSTAAQVRCAECTTDSDCQDGTPQSQFGPRCTSPNNLCGECLDDSDCQEQFSTKPFCNRSGARAKCEGCGGDYGSRSPRACGFARPLCLAVGACTTPCTPAGPTYPSSCTWDDNTEAACITTGSTAGHCVPCDGDFASGAGRACGAYRPICTAGACTQCTRTNTVGCGSQSACDTNAKSCASCTGDYGDLTQPSCPTVNSPVCKEGACTKCTSDADCSGHAAGSICNLTTGACGLACTSNSDCNASPLCAGDACWCQGAGTKVCTPKTPNGGGMTNAPPVLGVCDATNAQATCLSGVCDAASNTCGLAQGATCGPPVSHASCVSGTCSPSDYKCGGKLGDACRTTTDCREGLCAGGTCAECGFDTDCKDAKKPICDATTHTCRGCAEATTSSDCRSAGRTACAVSGTEAGGCVECTLTDPGACRGTKPACDGSLAKCVACNGNFGSGVSAACPEDSFLCQPDGRCVPCNRDEQCIGNAKGPACDLVTGQCGPLPPPPQKVDAGSSDAQVDSDAGPATVLPQTQTTSDDSCSSRGRPATTPTQGLTLLMIALGTVLRARRRATP